MAIGNILPREEVVEPQVELSSTQGEPSTFIQGQPQDQDHHQDHDNSTPIQDQESIQDQFIEQGQTQSEDQQVDPGQARLQDEPHPQHVPILKIPCVQSRVQQANILGDPQEGVSTCSQVKPYEYHDHFAFVSFQEPLCVGDALNDLDWVEAMHEELNQFTYNKV
jgi:hypothetical protein